MFERFTDSARRVVVFAQEEGREFRHHYIGTEHLLLGILHEGENIASAVLEAAGITLKKAQDALIEIVGQGDQSPGNHIPFTPRAKKALELGLREALSLSHNHIGPEHILLGLIRDDESTATRIIGMIYPDDMALDKLRVAVLGRLKDLPPDAASFVGHRAEDPLPPNTPLQVVVPDRYFVSNFSTRLGFGGGFADAVSETGFSWINDDLVGEMLSRFALLAPGSTFHFTAIEFLAYQQWYNDLRRVLTLSSTHPLAVLYAAVSGSYARAIEVFRKQTDE